MSAERAHVINYFLEHHINFNDEWLTEVLKYLRFSKLVGTPLCKSVFDQWLHSDLAESTLSAFQKPSGKVAILEGCFMFQVLKYVDIANSYWGQYRKATHKNDDYDFFDIISKQDLPADAPEKKSKRMFMLELTDGIETIKAIEYHPVHFFTDKMPSGAKILIYGKIKVRNGILWLTEQNCQLLGGDLFPLCQINRQEAVLGRLLKKTQYLTEAISEDLMKTKITDSPPRKYTIDGGGVMVQKSGKDKLTVVSVTKKQPAVVPVNQPATRPQVQPTFGSRPPDIIPVIVPVRRPAIPPQPEIITLSPSRPILAPINLNPVKLSKEPRLPNIANQNPFKLASNFPNILHEEKEISVSKVSEHSSTFLINFPSTSSVQQDSMPKKKRIFEISKERAISKHQSPDIVEDSEDDVISVVESEISEQYTTPKKKNATKMLSPNSILSDYGIAVVSHIPEQLTKSLNSSEKSSTSETSSISLKPKSTFRDKIKARKENVVRSLLDDNDFEDEKYIPKEPVFSTQEFTNLIEVDESESDRNLPNSYTSSISSVASSAKKKSVFGEPTLTSTPISKYLKKNLSNKEHGYSKPYDLTMEIKEEPEDDDITIISPVRSGITNWARSPEVKRRRISAKLDDSKPDIIKKYEKLKLSTITVALKTMKYAIGAKRFSIEAITLEIVEPISIVDDEWTMKILISDSCQKLGCSVSNELLCSLMVMTPKEAMALKKSSDEQRRKDGNKKIEEISEGIKHLDLVFEIEFFPANRILPKIVGLKPWCELLEL